VHKDRAMREALQHQRVRDEGVTAALDAPALKQHIHATKHAPPNVKKLRNLLTPNARWS
jgi:hypothetical protein